MGPPVFWFARVIVMFGLSFSKLSWVVLLIRYSPDELSHLSPNAFSNCWHTSVGSHNSGTDESIYASSGVDINVVFPEAVVEVIDRIVTTMSRKLSLVIVKITSLGVNLEASYPPNIKLPSTPFRR